MSGIPSRKSAKSSPPIAAASYASLGGRARECEGAARVLLPQVVELLPPEVATDGNIVPIPAP